MSARAWYRYYGYRRHYVFTFSDIIVTHYNQYKILHVQCMLRVDTTSHICNIMAYDIPLLVNGSNLAPAGNRTYIITGGGVVNAIGELYDALNIDNGDDYRLIPTSDKLLNAMCQIEGTIRAEMW